MKTFDKNTSRCARGTVSGGVCVVCERAVCECRCGAVVGEPRESGEHEVHRGRTMIGAERRREEENEKSDGRENQQLLLNKIIIIITMYLYKFFYETK